MLQIAICDDSQTDILQLKDILKEIMDKYSICYNIREYDSGEKLLETKEMFHLIFLDIIMNGKDGMEVGKQIYRANRDTKIIFQTNFGQLCREAMNRAHAFAFLEKPLQMNEVEEQIKEFFESSDRTTEISADFRNIRYISDGKEITKKFLSIPIKDIVYFELVKGQKEMELVTTSGEYAFAESMSILEERMKPFGFEICRRGMLVNMGRIKKIKRYDIYLDTGEIIPLSQRRAAEFKERINEYIHNSFS